MNEIISEFYRYAIRPFTAAATDYDSKIEAVGLWIFLILVAFIICFIGFLIHHVYVIIRFNWRYKRALAFKHKARLLSTKFKLSTEETNTVPVVSTGGHVGIGVVTTGEEEAYITIWDCGKYGRLVSEDEEVFRFAKEESVLWLKELDGDAYIDGINVEEVV